MTASTTFGDHYLLEEMEKNLTGTLMRCATLDGGKLEKHHLLEILDPTLSNDPGFLKSFLDHVQITSKLEHPNFMNKTGVLQEGGKLAAIYDFHEGFTLEKILSSCQAQYIPMSLDHALLVTSKLLSVLVYGKTKNLSHGLIHPSQIFITNEGEVKLRGFSLMPSMSVISPAPPALNPANNRYLPQGVDFSQTSAEHLDIYACGNLFYEILIGKPFSSPPAEAGSVISQARMENDGEPIPTKIANMLVSALGMGQPTAYQSIRKMADDMEQMLLSGQYNPTTFNLAFFMNSSLREDMDALEKKLEQEKAATYQQAAKVAPLPPKTAVASAAVVTPPVRTAHPETVPPPEKKKSKAILWVALLLLLILGFGFIYFFYLKKDDGGSQFARQQELIKAEGEQLELEQARKAQEAKDREIEQLKLLVQQQTEAERARKKKEIEEEMAAMDEEIERLKSQEDQQRKQKEMNDQLEKLKAEKAALEERERQAQEERDRLAQLEKEREQEKQQEQERLAAEEAAKQEQPEQPQIAQPDAQAGNEPTADNGTDINSTMPVAPPEPISTTADNQPVYYVGQPGVTTPVFTRKTAPNYPQKAKRMKVQGTVTLEAVFRSDGKVGKMDVVKGVGKGRFGLEEAAMQAVKQWKFRPGKFQGNPANVRLKVSVDFVLQ